MKKDRHKTEVIFLKNLKNEVYDWCFANFPHERWSMEIGVYNSYSHVGQHSACHIDYARESVPCTKEEYKNLHAELTGLGYNLNVLDKLPLMVRTTNKTQIRNC